MSPNYLKFINEAHKIAKKNFGNSFPNPVVGCLIAKKNKLISKAVTNISGRPHAEEIALKKAGKRATGATMYVTLEPCFHNSINGSCVDQILRAGIKEIYISTKDPDKRTNSKSIKKLKLNKVNVIYGLHEEKTLLLNKFFFHSIKNKRPYTKIKMAISKDQKIAWKNYKSKWISNSKSREYAHYLRSKSQAILTTSKTIIKDNPRFTIRIKDKKIKHLPIIIIDNSLNTPINSRVMNERHNKRIIIFTFTKNKLKVNKFVTLGCEVIIFKKNSKGYMSLKKIFKKLYLLKISDLLVEAGGIFFSNLIYERLVDEIHLFQAEFDIGKKGIPMLINKKISDLDLMLIKKKKITNNYYYKYSVLK